MVILGTRVVLLIIMIVVMVLRGRGGGSSGWKESIRVLPSNYSMNNDHLFIT